MDHGWYRYLKHHTLVPVPNRPDQDFDALAQDLDAFVITGGDDPALRRSTELHLARLMMQNHKPTLGVCHGCFLLTDVLGGRVEEITGHMDTEHDVQYLGLSQRVNSFHSLAVTQPHNGAQILATDDHGHCEAWIDGYLAGVVWHPERMPTPWLPSEISILLKV